MASAPNGNIIQLRSNKLLRDGTLSMDGVRIEEKYCAILQLLYLPMVSGVEEVERFSP